jgi:hypothetical protein
MNNLKTPIDMEARLNVIEATHAEVRATHAEV